jgi:hypothetical protein
MAVQLREFRGMPQALLARDLGWVEPDVSHLVTEDDAPVDNFFCESQRRLLTEPLHSSWAGPPRAPDAPPRPFIASANVGLYQSIEEPPLVPDVLLSVDVKKPGNWSEKKNRVYFVWSLGKSPDVAIEIVSNREGGELSDKLRRYEKIRIPYYVVFDPECHLSHEPLHAFEMHGDRLEATTDLAFPRLGLGLALWNGEFEGLPETWLRWTDATGAWIPTGAERAAEAEAKVTAAEAKLAAEHARADEAEAREARLRAKLRALGIDDET